MTVHRRLPPSLPTGRGLYADIYHRLTTFSPNSYISFTVSQETSSKPISHISLHSFLYLHFLHSSIDFSPFTISASCFSCRFLVKLAYQHPAVGAAAVGGDVSAIYFVDSGKKCFHILTSPNQSRQGFPALYQGAGFGLLLDRSSYRLHQ